MGIRAYAAAFILFGAACGMAQAADGTAAPAGLAIQKGKAVEGFSQQKRKLTRDESKDLAEMEETCFQIVQLYLPRIKKADVSAEVLDQAYELWLQDKNKDKPGPNTVILAFGVRLGSLALKASPGSWYHVKDNYGEGLAIEFRKSGQQIYPIDSIQKRYARQESGFFSNLYKMYLLAANDMLK
ncbi:MAG TPA: DUF3806 domain-containing protein [Candidatus Paceibacterota bacterium]